MKKKSAAPAAEKRSELFYSGRDCRAFDYMGAHPFVQDGEQGYLFRVYAPEAEKVSVMGEFNDWNRDADYMTRDEQGIWEKFIPNIPEYAAYKYSVWAKSGDVFDKSDPYGFHFETRPGNATKAYDIDGYEWGDASWLDWRKKHLPYSNPVNIYECHLGSWKMHEDGNFYSYRQLADELVPYVKEMGYTHIEFMPLTEYPFDGSWGYQVIGYFAATSRYGTPKDLMYLIDKAHQAGLGIIMDWVPAHFPKDGCGLVEFDGSHLYEYADPLKMEHKEWGTRVFDYGKVSTRNLLFSSAMFWIEKFHMDGLRVDAVASMLYLDYNRQGEWRPNVHGGRENLEAVDFLRLLNENMGWMNDMLCYCSADPFFRKDMHDKITFSFMYAFSENYILPLSHDEVVHGKCSLISKMPPPYENQFGGLRALYGYMAAHPGKKMLFMGGEFAQFSEWAYQRGLDWMLLDYPAHRQMQAYVKALNHFYLATPQLWEQDTDWRGFEWISHEDNRNNIIAFRRVAKDGSDIVVVVNFSPEEQQEYRIGVPITGTYEEIFTSDKTEFGGSGMANGKLKTENKPMHGQEQSIVLKIPRFGVLFFKGKARAKRRTKAEIEAAKAAAAKKPVKRTRSTKAVAKSGTKAVARTTEKAVAKTGSKSVAKTTEKAVARTGTKAVAKTTEKAVSVPTDKAVTATGGSK